MSVAQSFYAQDTFEIRYGDEEQRECLRTDDELKVDMTMETQAIGEWLQVLDASKQCSQASRMFRLRYAVPASSSLVLQALSAKWSSAHVVVTVSPTSSGVKPSTPISQLLDLLLNNNIATPTPNDDNGMLQLLIRDQGHS
ncbi:hypothetical protein LTR17_021395 [Elasticomyces elasticus]|nr:hypothetical protein LTR17_021395 [Elasticomyces elasticus]